MRGVWLELLTSMHWALHETSPEGHAARQASNAACSVVAAVAALVVIDAAVVLVD
jgi:hypothetical protein